MTNKLTLTESMSQLRQKLHDIEQGNVNEGAGRMAIDAATDAVKAGWKKLTGKAAEEALIKELGEKVVVKNERGEELILQLEKDGMYHLKDTTRSIENELKYTPERVKDIKDRLDPRKEPSIPPEVTEPHPTLLGPDGKPLQVPAKPKAAITDPVVKAIANEPISTDVPEITNMGSLYQYFQEHKPEELKKLAQNPTANTGFWKAASEKAKNNKGKIITIAALLLLLYFWASSDKTKEKEKDSTANAGGKTSEDGSAPIGTVIPAGQVPWKWVVTGSTDPNVDLDKIKNARKAYEQVESQSVTKNQDGKWQTPNGKVLTNDKGPATARLEQLAKMDPEKRKEMVRAETTQSFEVDLYRPGEDGSKLPVVPPVESDTANKEPDQYHEPEIVLATGGKCPAGYTLSKDGKTCEKEDPAKKKKKPDPKVLPTVKW